MPGKVGSSMLIDESYTIGNKYSPEEWDQLVKYMTKVRFFGGKKKFHIYERIGNSYVNTGRVEELTYEEYMEKYQNER